MKGRQCQQEVSPVDRLGAGQRLERGLPVGKGRTQLCDEGMNIDGWHRVVATLTAVPPNRPMGIPACRIRRCRPNSVQFGIEASRLGYVRTDGMYR